ncbi:hypothetical protein ACP70R_037204 [Stipagrostis hirtigluma subsp. patula]
MRIRKGNQVEVWMQEAGSPVGAWRGGEVLWGNGHSYVLRWHDGAPDSGRISRKFVRPPPPSAPVPADLDAGDMVEVFDDDDWLWKCAEVQYCAGGGGEFRVKIVGAAKVLTVPPRKLRVRQMLREDDAWVVLRKDNQIAGVSARPPPGKGKGKSGPVPVAPPDLKPLKQKRSPFMPGAEPFASGRGPEHNSIKRLRVEEEPRYEVEVIEVGLNKQDEMGVEDCDVVGTGSTSNLDDGYGHHHPYQHHRPVADDDDDDDDDDDSDESVSSSDDSSDSDSRTRSNDAGDCVAAAAASAGHDQDADQLQNPEADHYCDDTAESGESTRECLDGDEKAAVAQGQVHRLELEAYTALMKAFHASGGPLSWAKAELLTDLRKHLHISNDEHLQVINVFLNRKGRPGGRPGKF